MNILFVVFVCGIVSGICIAAIVGIIFHTAVDSFNGRVDSHEAVIRRLALKNTGICEKNVDEMLGNEPIGESHNPIEEADDYEYMNEHEEHDNE